MATNASEEKSIAATDFWMLDILVIRSRKGTGTYSNASLAAANHDSVKTYARGDMCSTNYRPGINPVTGLFEAGDHDLGRVNDKPPERRGHRTHHYHCEPQTRGGD